MASHLFHVKCYNSYDVLMQENNVDQVEGTVNRVAPWEISFPIDNVK